MPPRFPADAVELNVLLYRTLLGSAKIPFNFNAYVLS